MSFLGRGGEAILEVTNCLGAWKLGYRMNMRMKYVAMGYDQGKLLKNWEMT